MSEKTPQEKIKTKLESLGLPFKKIDVYGRQIVITTLGKKTIDKWVDVLGKFAKVRGTTHSFDYNKENKNTCLILSRHEVYRVFARI